MSLVNVHDIDGKSYSVDSAELIFNPAVYGVVIRDGQVLLLPINGKYAIPGGSIEMGENHIDALKREVKEETGFDVEPVRLINVHTSLYRSFKTGKNFHCLQLFYLCRVVSGSNTAPTFTDDEKHYLKPAQWFPVQDLGNMQYIGAEPVFDEVLALFNSGEIK
ncbi:MAG: NUDIX domain-containing protein [Alphaproteobacteria bacterium]|nr:NUDIX domain-containing protein [Alphaproteobacteria bacterium]